MKNNGIGSHKISNITDIKNFMFAGHSVLTIVNKNTGNRFTFKINKPKDNLNNIINSLFFVAVLSGSDNTSNYNYMGTAKVINKSITYQIGNKSKISNEATSQKAFIWFVNRLNNNNIPDYLEVWHEGHCGRCGKLLTVPESIKNGLGPVCLGKNQF